MASKQWDVIRIVFDGLLNCYEKVPLPPSAPPRHKQQGKETFTGCLRTQEG
jgi:hypothetical protein